MSNEQKHTTCLAALRAEIAETSTRLEYRVEQVEQAFSSLGWEADQLRSNLKVDAALLQESNASLNARSGDLEAALHTMFTPAQVCERVNLVHDEVMAKLSAERKEVERLQKLCQEARDERDAARSERDEARLECQTRIMQARGLRTHCRAQVGRIDVLANSLEIMGDLLTKSEVEVQRVEKQKEDLDKDYGKLVEVNEDLARDFEDIKGRYEQLRRAAEGSRPGEHIVTRATQAEMLHQFKGHAYDILKCVGDMTNPAVSALQYGAHHGHQTLHKHIVKYRRFHHTRTTPPGEVPDEVLRENQG
jgi:DNA repair exonuclease SbcCD ATPase subunit